MNILVIYGDKYAEREISLRSGAAVATALKKLGHKVFTFDPRYGYKDLGRYIGVVDCVLPILHGEGGEDGKVQIELEKRKFKYLGTQVKASKLFINKQAFKQQAKKLGFNVPSGELVTAKTFKSSRIRSGAHVLKPNSGGSSIDTFIVRDYDDDPVDPSIFKKYEKMLLEELIVGIEVTVPILGTKALPVVEIIPPPGGEFDYKNKYNGKTQEICPPRSLAIDLQKKTQKVALKLHKSLGAKDISRTDMIITPNEQIYVLELNTMPGLTDQSLFPKSARSVGLSFEDLIQELVEITLNTL